MKKDILNWVRFWPKKEWNPHSKALFFSWYGLCGDSKIFIPKSITAKIGMNIKKKVKVDIKKNFFLSLELTELFLD